MSDYNVNDALRYLHVDKDRALRKAGRLINCGSLVSDLFEAQVAIGKFETPIGLSAALKNDLGTISIPTFNPIEIPSSVEVTQGADTCLNVGYAFLSFIGQLWGLSPELSLMVLADVYDPVPGWSRSEVLLSIRGIFAVTSLVLVAAATGGASIPFYAYAGVGLLGLGTSLLALKDQYDNGLVSLEDAYKQTFFIILLGAIDVAGIKVSSLLTGKIFAKVVANSEFIKRLDELSFLVLDTATSKLDDYEGTIELLTTVLVESGMTATQASQVARSTIDQIQKEAQQYKLKLPKNATTYKPGSYEGTPGPIQLPIEVINGIEASGPDNPVTATPPGQYSKDEISEVLKLYPDFDAWWQQREKDLGYTGTEFEAAILRSKNGIHDVVGNFAIPNHYYDLIWLKLLYVMN